MTEPVKKFLSSDYDCKVGWCFFLHTKTGTGGGGLEQFTNTHRAIHMAS